MDASRQYRLQEAFCLRLASEASEAYVKTALTSLPPTTIKGRKTQSGGAADPSVMAVRCEIADPRLRSYRDTSGLRSRRGISQKPEPASRVMVRDYEGIEPPIVIKARPPQLRP